MPKDASACWSVTVWEDEFPLIEDSSNFPSFVTKVYGGREECPSTKKIHFQGAVLCKSQQRFSAIKKWLPTAHIEPARQKDALIKYAMKDDTAVGEKMEHRNPREFLTMAKALRKIASYVFCNMEQFVLRQDQYANKHGTKWTMKISMEEDFWWAVNRLLRSEDEENISLYSNPQLLRAWIHTHETWRLKYEADKESTIVLQDSPDDGFKDDPELKGEIEVSQESS